MRPRPAARSMAGTASRYASAAASRSPARIARTTFLTDVRRRERADWLRRRRVSFWRPRFLACAELATGVGHSCRVRVQPAIIAPPAPGNQRPGGARRVCGRDLRQAHLSRAPLGTLVSRPHGGGAPGNKNAGGTPAFPGALAQAPPRGEVRQRPLEPIPNQGTTLPPRGKKYLAPRSPLSIPRACERRGLLGTRVSRPHGGGAPGYENAGETQAFPGASRFGRGSLCGRNLVNSLSGFGGGGPPRRAVGGP